MADLKYKPVRHDHAEFLAKAKQRPGFSEAYDALEPEYALASRMHKARTKSSLVLFDAARYLGDGTAIAEYINAAIETGDTDLLLLALGDVAHARGMAQVAKDAGLGRESLYKALTSGAKPRFDTVIKVARALGVQLTVRPVSA
jgi:probable addiction module antidote protein